GLVRREHDRAVSQYSADAGGGTDLDTGAIIASEVTNLEFMYFDGTEWQTSWDTSLNGSLPQAVKISLVLGRETKNGEEATTYASVADALAQDPDNVYSIVVRLPASDPIDPYGTGSGTGASGSGSSSSGDSSGGSGSGSSGS